jgi:nitric oxide dioxygenase
MTVEPGPRPRQPALEGHAVVVADRQGVIRIWSAGAETLFGHSSAATLGRSLDLLIPEPYRPRHWSAYHAAVASGVNHYEGAVFADPIIHADGTVVHHRGRITLLKDAAGTVIGVASTWGPARIDDRGRTGPAVVAREVR